jgi:hypothetical protein
VTRASGQHVTILADNGGAAASVKDVASNQVPGVPRLAWRAEIQVIKLVCDATRSGLAETKDL